MAQNSVLKDVIEQL